MVENASKEDEGREEEMLMSPVEVNVSSERKRVVDK